MKLLALTVPYVAVLIGVHLLKSGWAAILLYHAGMLAFLPLLGGVRSLGACGRGWSARTFALLVLPCLISGPALYVLVPLLAPSLDLGAALDSLGLGGSSWLLFMVYYTIVNPWLEEGYWRGALGSSSSSITASDVFFGGYHVLVLAYFIPWYLGLLVAALLMGVAWVWRKVATRCGGLLIPALTHLAADASVILAVHALARWR
jgi:hypothetical protein